MAQTDSFQQDIVKCISKFSEVASNVLNSMLEAKHSKEDISVIPAGVVLENKFVISILFTGTVYGEYIFAIDEATASKLLGQSQPSREEIADVFSEILNIIVGESVIELHNLFQKLTMTPPRVHFGSLRYPKIKTGHAVLKSEHGVIDCFLVIDRMKLDLATSYQDTLNSLTIAHQELQAAMKNLQQQQTLLVQSEKLAALGTVAAGVAHEINTPLSVVSIVGSKMKDLVDEPTLDKDALIKMLNTIEATVVRISKITKSLWSFALRMNQDKIGAFTLKDLIEDTLLMCDHRLKGAAIAFSRNNALDDVVIEGHLPQISQVLMNLLFNSCEAVEKLSDKWIKVDFVDLGGEVEIKITDSGKGISANVQEKMFEPFFTTKELEKNVGLGLSISRQIIEEHGGFIKVDNSVPNTNLILRFSKKYMGSRVKTAA